ncbi:MAG: agmatinase [Hyphomicrobiaceae bacterium]
MDKDKLEALRAKYADASGGDIHDPGFRAVADRIFTSPDRRKWPFSDVATFLGAPYRADAAKTNFQGLDVALVGVPMDLGVTNRAGSRLGPRAVRAVERVGPYEHALRLAPITSLEVADVGDVPMQSRFDLAQCHADIEAWYRELVAAGGVVPLSVGGDHSISLPILKALGADRPVGMLHIDAHCDTSGPYEGSRFHHGGPFREAVLAGVLDPERTVQIGIRGGAEYLWEFSRDSGMQVFHAEAVDELGVAAIVTKARQVLGDGPTYVSFDIDSIDPGLAPGTGTPEVGGLTPREVLGLLRGMAGIDIVGGDVVEVAPQYDATTATAQIGAQMLFELLCLVALRPKPA